MDHGLQLRFDDPAGFRREYAEHIEKGGAFIPTPHRFELRAVVDVEVQLVWARESVHLEAEIVHCTPAGTDAREAGVAVQFLEPPAELRELLGRFAEADDVVGLDFGSEPLELEEDAAVAEPSPEPELDPEPVPEPEPGLEPEPELELVSHVFPEESAEEEPAPSARAVDPEFEFITPPAEPEPDAPPRERRKAERRTARLPAQLDCAHISLDGRTRDLSETGVLLSADASDLPVGKKVRVALNHPNTGERLEIDGTVARRVAGGGTVAAVGIEFDLPEEGQEEVREFIRQVNAAESVRRESGISGVIEEVGMASLLQMFGTSSKGGTLSTASGAEEGVIAFEAGQLRYARLGSLRGTKALARMLGWESGVFEFQGEVDPLEDEDERMPLDAAILEAARQVDEAARTASSGLDPRAVLCLRRDALTQLDRPFTQTEEAVIDLAAAGLTVRRLMDVIPETDAEILEALTTLRDRGLVGVDSPD